MEGVQWHRANAVALVYDVCSRDSFMSLGKWHRRLTEVATAPLEGVVIANKTDVDDDRVQVPDEEGQEFAEAHRFSFHKCSAKRGTGLREPLQALARRIAASFAETVAVATAAT
jgi:Ras-related protein Rab-8A